MIISFFLKKEIEISSIILVFILIINVVAVGFEVVIGSLIIIVRIQLNRLDDIL